MSGSFEKLDVPPTLVSFAAAIGDTRRIISPEFKLPGSKVMLLQPKYNGLVPNADSLKALYAIVQGLIASGKVLACATPGYGCVAECLFKMGLGNRIGFALSTDVDVDSLFRPAYGSFVLEMEDEQPLGAVLGVTTGDYTFRTKNELVDLAAVQEGMGRQAGAGDALPGHKPRRGPGYQLQAGKPPRAEDRRGTAQGHYPRVPGHQLRYTYIYSGVPSGGADPQVLVINNLTPAAVAESCEALVKAIDGSQIVMLPGGFSGGDEPDGSAKFITAFFRAPAVTEAVHRLLKERDGLMLGICNGFQALIKLGLCPTARSGPSTPTAPP